MATGNGKKGGHGGNNKPPPRRTGGPSREELRLWRYFTEDITPLRPVDWSGLDDAPDAPPPQISERTVPIDPAPARRAAPPAMPDQIDRRTHEKLRKGQMTIEARLDLHGYSQERAHSALHDFIVATQRRGKRCVLVITGKGKSHMHDDQDWVFNDSVLRARVPEWLSTPPLSALTLKCLPAQPKHGGEGAYYVYLKRTP